MEYAATPKTNSPRKHEDHVVILESRLRPRKAPVQEQADSEEESSASGDDGTGDDTGNESESEDEDTVYAEKIMNERTREVNINGICFSWNKRRVNCI